MNTDLESTWVTHQSGEDRSYWSGRGFQRLDCREITCRSAELLGEESHPKAKAPRLALSL